MLYHYAGQRTKNCQKLGESFCLWTNEIEIRLINNQPEFRLNGARLSYPIIEKLAIDDGFGDYPFPAAAMFNFFKDRLPFEGQIIYWGQLL